jgi:hypothetical protein
MYIIHCIYRITRIILVLHTRRYSNEHIVLHDCTRIDNQPMHNGLLVSQNTLSVDCWAIVLLKVTCNRTALMLGYSLAYSQARLLVTATQNMISKNAQHDCRTVAVVALYATWQPRHIQLTRHCSCSTA